MCVCVVVAIICVCVCVLIAESKGWKDQQGALCARRIGQSLPGALQVKAGSPLCCSSPIAVPAARGLVGGGVQGTGRMQADATKNVHWGIDCKL